MITIVGLVSNQQSVGQAIESLAEQGLAESLRLIRPSLSEGHGAGSYQMLVARDHAYRTAIGSSSAQAVLPAASALMNEQPSQPKLENLQNELIRFGVDEEQARFCAQGVRHGGNLLLLEVNEEQQTTALEILEAANAVMAELEQQGS